MTEPRKRGRPRKSAEAPATGEPEQVGKARAFAESIDMHAGEFSASHFAPGFAYPHPDPMRQAVTRGDLTALLVRLSAQLQIQASRLARQGHDSTATASLTLGEFAYAFGQVAAALSAEWQAPPATSSTRETLEGTQ